MQRAARGIPIQVTHLFSDTNDHVRTNTSVQGQKQLQMVEYSRDHQSEKQEFRLLGPWFR